MDMVFFHEKMITFNPEKLAEGLKVRVADSKDMSDFIFRWLQEERKKDVLLYGYDVKQMKKDFKSIFHFVKAAGGVVQNNKNKILFIRRWNRWDLPKGKIEKHEKISDCAVREVEEETGVKNLTVIKKLSSSYHIFETIDHWYLKKTHWFLMKTTFDGKPVPQNEEDITQVQWMNKEQCFNALASTYRSLREVLADDICVLL